MFNRIVVIVLVLSVATNLVFSQDQAGGGDGGAGGDTSPMTMQQQAQAICDGLYNTTCPALGSAYTSFCQSVYNYCSNNTAAYFPGSSN